MNKNELIRWIEDYAPLNLQEDWDNSGWQIKLPIDEINNVMICVTVTKNVLEQAIEKGVNLIIAHHPLIFPNIRTIDDEVVCMAIKNDIQVYSMHTNFDKADIGTSGFLAKELGFTSLERVDDYIQIANLDEEWALDNVIIKAKLALNIEKVKVLSYDTTKMIRRIAFVAGSGGSFIEKLNDYNIDLFITSDIKYHDEVKDRNYVIIDVGHLESERPALKRIVDIISPSGIGVFLADEKKQKIYL